MGHLNSFRGGDCAEYFTQALLSSFSFTTAIARQEDNGIDFNCTIINKQGEMLYPAESFNIQCKSYKDQKYIELEDKIKKGADPGFCELHWLFGLNTPLFLSLYDYSENKISVFSLACLWHLYFENIDLRGKKIRLNFNDTPGRSENTYGFDLEKAANGKYEFNIGTPIITIKATEANNENGELNPKIDILKKVIAREEDNIYFKRHNVPIMRWLHRYETNVDTDENKFKFGLACYTRHNPRNIDPNELRNNLGQTLIAICDLYKTANNPLYNDFLPIIKNLPADDDRLKQLLQVAGYRDEHLTWIAKPI